MRKDREDMVKKLALAYQTGWEYMPGSEEAGSVLTDIFLSMEEKNQKRFDRIWERQELAFLTVVPETQEEKKRLETELSVRAFGENDGRQLESGTKAYTVSEDGETLYFYTLSPIKLTTAKLICSIYCMGLFAWLCYEKGDDMPVSFFQPSERELSHPVFTWKFQGLCDGHTEFTFIMLWDKPVEDCDVLPGKWTFSDGQNSYPAKYRKNESVFLLEGDCPEFKNNLEGSSYELRMELFTGEELSRDWVRAINGNLTLKEKEEWIKPEICLTDAGAASYLHARPFGGELAPASYFYVSCDRAAARRGGQITLLFLESFEIEEKLPEEVSAEQKKLFRKYPWMQAAERVKECRPEKTSWEYFNGSYWSALPGSEDWKTGCDPEHAGERSCCFQRPQDMQPCMIDGSEHFYLRFCLNSVINAYALYYKKYIPVLENIRFMIGERIWKPVEKNVPKLLETMEKKVYLGFDRDITPEHCWYIGGKSYCFQPEQIRGYGTRFGKKAYWAELREEEEMVTLLPNYVRVLQELPEQETDTGPGRLPKDTLFYLETDQGILEAASLSDARFDKAGAPVQEIRKNIENYFAHFGRLLTPKDLEFLLQERYPYFRVRGCLFHRENRELEIELEIIYRNFDREETVIERLAEIEEWLGMTFRQMGAIWLQGISVHCTLHDKKQDG